MSSAIDWLSDLKNTGACKAYAAGEVIFREGDPGELMYVILNGEVQVTLEKLPINYLVEGSIFGEMALVDNSPRSASAVAATDCILLPLDQTQFKALIPSHPEFSVEVMSVMAQRLRRSIETTLQRQRMEEELIISREIQLSLLPLQCPEISGWEVAAYYRAARQVGGDLYDFIQTSEAPNLLHLVVADVTGKGVPAALYMAVSRTILRTATQFDSCPAQILRRTNQTILQDVGYRLFLSTFFASLNTQTGHFIYANGGHEWPMLYRADTGTVQNLDTSGLLLGVFRDMEFPQTELFLAPGDVLVLFTDGVTEARDATGDFFGEERLAEILAQTGDKSARQLMEDITQAVGLFTGETPQADDLTLIVLK
ncbi:MAG TPA: SpoIIE family protein phosphatase, partial [Anaerolineales bacterium]|nr:SpoIIE family protein phosphatase [Anaerolineales bacterium]